MIVKVEHDPDCPLGVNGMRGYHEARSAMSDQSPECRADPNYMSDLALAEHELEALQVCNCGADEYNGV